MSEKLKPKSLKKPPANQIGENAVDEESVRGESSPKNSYYYDDSYGYKEFKADDEAASEDDLDKAKPNVK